jgi:FOG: PKD repeat
MTQLSKVFLVTIFLLYLAAPASAESAMEISISGSSPDGYQLLMNIPYETYMESDFSDIRFYADNTRYDGGTELDYWVENYSASTSANVWIPVPSGTSVIYCQWDIPGETASQSDPYAVMTFYDNFTNSSQWSTFNAQIVSNQVYMANTVGGDIKTSSRSWPSDYQFDYDFMLSQIGSYGPRMGVSYGTTSFGIETTAAGNAGAYNGVTIDVNGTRAATATAVGTWNTSMWYHSHTVAGSNAQKFQISIISNPEYGNKVDLTGSIARDTPDTGTIQAYIWDLAYGNKAYFRNFIVRLYDATPVTYSVGSVTTLPVPSFTTNVSSGYVPLTVQFTDTSTGGLGAWYWQFNDSGVSYIQNPTHTFSNIGTYNVSLTISNMVGLNTSYSTITVSVLPAPVANFTADPVNGSAPLTVQFTDTSTGSPTSWYWNFGSGQTSVLQNPLHTFYANGTYTVNLTVSNIHGNNSTTDIISVNGTATPNNYSQYKDVLFTSNMTSWDFPKNGATFYTLLIPSWFFWSVLLLIPYIGMYNRQGGIEIVAIIYLFTGGIVATVMPEQLAVYAKWFIIFGAVGVIYRIFIRE